MESLPACFTSRLPNVGRLALDDPRLDRSKVQEARDLVVKLQKIRKSINARGHANSSDWEKHLGTMTAGVSKVLSIYKELDDQVQAMAHTAGTQSLALIRKHSKTVKAEYKTLKSHAAKADKTDPLRQVAMRAASVSIAASSEISKEARRAQHSLDTAASVDRVAISDSENDELLACDADSDLVPDRPLKKPRPSANREEHEDLADESTHKSSSSTAAPRLRTEWPYNCFGNIRQFAATVLLYGAEVPRKKCNDVSFIM